MNFLSLLSFLFTSLGVAAAADSPKNVKSKGNVTPQIVGGEAAPLGTYPWFVRLGYLCGGSLISRQYVLTTADCAREGFTTAQIGAFASPHGNGTDAAALNGGQEMETLTIVDTTQHPNSDLELEFGADFALLKLEGPATAAPVPLDGRDGGDVVAGYDADKSHLFAVGFGLGDAGDYYNSNVLKHVDLKFVTQEDCNAIFADPYGFLIPDYMMCAASTNEDGYEGPCWGDGGGPLFDRDEGTQVGMISYGVELCEEAVAPSVYSRISAVFPWIQQTVCAGTDDPDSEPLCEGYTLPPTLSPSTLPPTGAPTMCDQTLIVVDITTDEFPGETSWTLEDQDNSMLASRNDYDQGNHNYQDVLCLPMAVYNFTIEDSAGDGIFSEEWGEGSYEVFMDGVSVASGGVFDRSESTIFPTVATYHTLASGACAVPVRTREQCKSAGAGMARDWKGAISNAHKPGGCVVINDKVAFNVEGEQGAGCKSHTRCVCAAPYALEDRRCARPLTRPLTRAACEEAAAVWGDAFAWKGTLWKGNKPRGCFASVERNAHGTITGGELAFNKKGTKGTKCKWGTPCVCSV